MSQINPITYVALQHIDVHRRGAAEKERALNVLDAQHNDLVAHDDVFEHQVEGAEEDHAALDENGQRKRQPKRQPPHHDQHDSGDDIAEDPHLDVTG